MFLNLKKNSFTKQFTEQKWIYKFIAFCLSDSNKQIVNNKDSKLLISRTITKLKNADNSNAGVNTTLDLLDSSLEKWFRKALQSI